MVGQTINGLYCVTKAGLFHCGCKQAGHLSAAPHSKNIVLHSKHTYIHVHTHTLQTHINTCPHTNTPNTHKYMSTHTHSKHTYIHVHTHTHTHTRTPNTHKYMSTHTHTQHTHSTHRERRSLLVSPHQAK